MNLICNPSRCICFMFFGVYIDIQLNVDFQKTRVIYLVTCFETQTAIPESVKLMFCLLSISNDVWANSLEK